MAKGRTWTSAEKVRSMNHRPFADAANEFASSSGTSGAVPITLNGVGGAAELRFTREVDADLSVRGGGGVSLELPNAKLEGERGRGALRAKVGAGGAPITIDDFYRPRHAPGLPTLVAMMSTSALKSLSTSCGRGNFYTHGSHPDAQKPGHQHSFNLFGAGAMALLDTNKNMTPAQSHVRRDSIPATQTLERIAR